MRKFLLACAAIAAGCAFSLSAAQAHPHVWVKVRAEALLDDEGRVVAIRHHWTFDDMYTAFVTTNLGKDGAPPTETDLAPVAKENVQSLEEFKYFTASKVKGKQIDFGKPQEYSMTYDAKQEVATLHFTLPLAVPAVAKPVFSFAVYDPSYFVAFDFDKGEAAQIVGGPKGCSISLNRPSQLSASDQQLLARAASENFSPGDDFAFRLADRAIIACP
jgi:ABC-type uncharacterized transport system substrate-binding protein